MLKALAWKTRAASKDAIDLWRTLEVAAVASVSPEAFTNEPFRAAAEVARQSFEATDGGAMRAIISAQGISTEVAQQRHTRILALIRRVFGA